MTAAPTLAVVVVNYGSPDLLTRHLVAVEDDLHRTGRTVTVVIVDNFRDDAARRATAVVCERRGWVFLAQDGNIGFGAGVDAGVAAARRAGATRFLLLNPDAWIDAASIAELEQVVDADPMTLAAPVITTPQGRIWSDGNDLFLRDGRTQATRKRPADAGPVLEWLSGACLLVHERLWDTVGGFGARYFLYWEDVDLSWRVQHHGGRVQVVRAAQAVHDEGGTHDDAVGHGLSNTFYYYNVRNRLLFAALRLDAPTRRRWVRHNLAAVRWMLLWGGRRQFVVSLSPVRAALRGTRDGMRLLRAHERCRSERQPVQVLASFPDPRPTTNPYIVMLRDSLQARSDVDLATFTWRRALTGRFEVFHAHWPEILVGGASPAKAAVRQVLFALFLLRCAVRRTAIVRTVHNLELPQGISHRERILLRLFDSRTNRRIRLNPHTPVGGPTDTILHGHYRDWFPDQGPPAKPGRVAFVGLVRRYKAVDTLVRAFVATPDPDPQHPLELLVAGNPSTPELAADLHRLAATDPRVHFDLRHLGDDELARAVRGASLVVLPAPQMHNSGTVVMVLSLDRPVLVPDNAVNRELAHEVGPGWVHLFDGEVTGADILSALTAVQSLPRAAPDLSARDWPHSAGAHADVYREARREVRARWS